MNGMMFSDTVELELYGLKMKLYADKYLYLPDQKTLILSDIHFGKINHFRKSGIGVPPNAAFADLLQLNKILDRHQGCNVVFLGDLFHSDYNLFVEHFRRFRQEFEMVNFTLVKGNHDTMDDKIYSGLNIDVVLSYEVGKILFSHEPVEDVGKEYYHICGHLHPAIIIKGSARQRLKLPCFYFGKHQGIMPAIGYFTGTSVIQPVNGDIIYGIANQQLVQINSTSVG